MNRGALISAFNKKKVPILAEELVKMGFVVYASAGTRKIIEDHGLPATDVADLVTILTRRAVHRTIDIAQEVFDLSEAKVWEFKNSNSIRDVVNGEPILGHQVVTLGRETAASLLARKGNHQDLMDIARMGIPFVDFVYVDLYPLETAIYSPTSTEESVEDMVDIGGITLIRAAAKRRRIVVASPNQIEAVTAWMKEGEPERERVTLQLAAEAEGIAMSYCQLAHTFRQKMLRQKGGLILRYSVTQR